MDDLELSCKRCGQVELCSCRGYKCAVAELYCKGCNLFIGALLQSCWFLGLQICFIFDVLAWTGHCFQDAFELGDKAGNMLRHHLVLPLCDPPWPGPAHRSGKARSA